MSYKLWKFNYAQHISTIDGDDKIKGSYYIIAQTLQEAKEKGEKYLRSTYLTPEYISESSKEVEFGKLVMTAREYNEEICCPKLALPEDNSNFFLKPKIIKKGNKLTLEYIVQPT